jgi:hypothetical protein
MVKILREADAKPIGEVAKSTASTSRRSTRGAGGSACSRRRRQAPPRLEAENSRLKKLLAEPPLDIEVLKERCSERRNGERTVASGAGPYEASLARAH